MNDLERTAIFLEKAAMRRLRPDGEVIRPKARLGRSGKEGVSGRNGGGGSVKKSWRKSDEARK